MSLFVLGWFAVLGAFVLNWLNAGEPPFGSMYHVQVVLGLCFLPLYFLMTFSSKPQSTNLKLISYFAFTAMLPVLGAVFMATDPVTSPVTAKGRWVFGIGCGLIAMTIRLWGGLPEGVMYSILLMNAITPLINRLTRPRRFGVGNGK